jgi:uncharacterized protein YndB with AHSA1/START domain
LVRIEKSVEIQATPEKVWEMLAFDREYEWMDVTEMKSGKYTSEVNTSEDKFRVGATVHIIEEHREQDVEITESLKNEKMTFRSKPPTKPPYVATYILTPIEGGTKLTFITDAEVPWGILGEVLGRSAIKSTEKQFEKALEKLKSILEK